MKYPYHVKANGRYYAPGEETEEAAEPETEEAAEPETPPKTRGRGKKTD